jgi:hypothetical protein
MRDIGWRPKPIETCRNSSAVVRTLRPHQDRAVDGHQRNVGFSGQAHRDLRRERRLLRGLGLARVIEAVCSRYGVDRGQLAARGSRSQARAYLAKHHTEATRAELVPILGLSRPERLPNLSARFAALLCSRPNRTRGEISWHWNSPSA